MAPFGLLSGGSLRPDYSSNVHGVNPSYMDRHVNPAEDFFRYCNGAWLASSEIPKNSSEISASLQTRARNEELMWRLVAPTMSDDTSPVGTPEQIIGQFLRTGLDEMAAGRQGTRPIQGELDRIAAIQSRSDVMGEIARLHRWSIPAVFRSGVGFDYFNSQHRMFYLTQGGLSLYGRAMYLADDSHAKNVRLRFQRIVQKSLTLLGDDPAGAILSAQRVLAIENRIAQAWLPESEVAVVERNFHKVRFADLASMTSGVDWSRYFFELGAKESWTVNVEQPEYLSAIGKLIQQVSIKDWKTYLRWQFINSVSPFLSSDFVQQSFELNSALSGQQQMRSRAQCVLEEADACLGSELGQLLYRTGFGMDCKPKVLSMVQSIRAALHKTIEQLDWMSVETKKTALDKLDHIEVQVCYPDRWPDTSKLVLTNGSYAQNVMRAREFEFQRQLDAVSKPADPTDWDIRSYAVDARYRPSLNTVFLPAGILQPPYFDMGADDASNYGSLGVVIGHELMHAFDGRGRKFDANGNLNNWWSSEDSSEYEKHQKGLIDQFNEYPALEQLKVDGRLTLEENVADLGGLTVAFAAFKQTMVGHPRELKDGFSPEQRFFISFAQLFRSKRRPESTRLLVESDPHAPPQVRVKGVLQNMPEFWKAFHLKPPLTPNTIW